MQVVMEDLVQKVVTQTNTIAVLQASIETMNDTMNQQSVVIGELNKVNNVKLTSIKEVLKENTEIISSIKKSLNQTSRLNRNKSYAETAREGIATMNETPKSFRLSQTPRSTKPVVNGTSSNILGKPISPNQLLNKGRVRTKSMPVKAVWISRLHRDTTEKELELYIKESIGIVSTDTTVRKLVKKDRDISTYSFVSFRITCTETNFTKLMDPIYWPSNCQIREFELEQQSFTGAKLNRITPCNNSESKNEEQPHDSMEV